MVIPNFRLVKFWHFENVVTFGPCGISDKVIFMFCCFKNIITLLFLIFYFLLFLQMDKLKMFKGLSGNMLRPAACKLIEKLSMSRMPFHGEPVIGELQCCQRFSRQLIQTDCQHGPLTIGFKWKNNWLQPMAIAKNSQKLQRQDTLLVFAKKYYLSWYAGRWCSELL